MDEKVILSAQVPTAQRDRLAHLAATHDRSLSGEVRRALDTYLRLIDPGALPLLGPDGVEGAAPGGGAVPSSARGEDA
jgi:hypothetical protein